MNYTLNVPVPVLHPESKMIIGHRAKWHGVMPGEPVCHYINRHEVRKLARGKKWHGDDMKRPNPTPAFSRRPGLRPKREGEKTLA